MMIMMTRTIKKKKKETGKAKDKNEQDKEKIHDQVQTDDLTIKDVWNRLDRIENLLLSLKNQ